jgi:hypothetical protein
VYSDKVDSILSAGVWLGPHHRNWALKREQALTAISCLRDAYCIVLGGDVLNGPDKNYSHTYDNWFFQPSNPPVPGDVPSSALKAIAYVRDYPLDEAVLRACAFTQHDRLGLKSRSEPDYRKVTIGVPSNTSL